MAIHPASPQALVINGAEVIALRFEEDGSFPNNPELPALVYRGALHLSESGDPAAVLERIFAANGWSRSWRDDVYGYHHYHSTAHEALGCFAGRARLQIGGPSGPEVELTQGDVLVLPAGVSHKKLESSEDFCVVGCYAGGRAYDMMYGHADERPEADERIRRIPLPEADPVYGVEGPLTRYWNLPRPRADREFRP